MKQILSHANCFLMQASRLIWNQISCSCAKNAEVSPHKYVRTYKVKQKTQAINSVTNLWIANASHTTET